MRKSSPFWLLTLLIGGAVATGQDVGPSNGALVVVGGAMSDPGIVSRFLDLAGGPDVPIVVIPTAGGADVYDQSWSGLTPFARQGATRLTVLHTTDRDVADTDAFTDPIRTARGVWFSGGRQWRLADAYLSYAGASRDSGCPGPWWRRGGDVGGCDDFG